MERIFVILGLRKFVLNQVEFRHGMLSSNILIIIRDKPISIRNFNGTNVSQQYLSSEKSEFHQLIVTL